MDFFDFDFFNLEILGRTYDRFPIFNVADAAVTVGVFILLLFYKQHSEEFSVEEEVTGDGTLAATREEEFLKNENSNGSTANEIQLSENNDNEIPEISSSQATIKTGDGENNNREEIPV